MKKIIIIIEDKSKENMIAEYLEKEANFLIEVTHKNSMDTFLCDKPRVDMFIIDIKFSNNYGWTICREIRKKSAYIPIIVLTPVHEDIYELYGFELGIDDYIRKPFNPQVLIARMNRILTRKSNEMRMMYAFNELKVDKGGHTVSVNGKPLKLRPKEYALLLYLVEHQGRAISRDQILADVWNYDYDGYQRTVDSHIKKIRKKLGNNRTYIQTIRNFGYKFCTSN